MTQPYSAACERNREPILAVLRHAFTEKCGVCQVLEVGAGTGQHAVYFARQMPHLTWHPGDLGQAHAGILAWMADEPAPNLRPPLLLDMGVPQWWQRVAEALPALDAIYSANTLHIMNWAAVQSFFAGVDALLRAGGLLAVYGPFNGGRRHTSPGNAAFDAELRARGSGSGLRDVEAVHELAAAAGLARVSDTAMPANNRLLLWRKT